MAEERELGGEEDRGEESRTGGTEVRPRSKVKEGDEDGDEALRRIFGRLAEPGLDMAALEGMLYELAHFHPESVHPGVSRLLRARDGSERSAGGRARR